MKTIIIIYSDGVRECYENIRSLIAWENFVVTNLGHRDAAMTGFPVVGVIVKEQEEN